MLTKRNYKSFLPMVAQPPSFSDAKGIEELEEPAKMGRLFFWEKAKDMEKRLRMDRRRLVLDVVELQINFRYFFRCTWHRRGRCGNRI
jgi:hypothetical protein